MKIVRCNSHWDLKTQQIGHTFRKIKHYLKLHIQSWDRKKKCITKSRINGHRITRQKDLWSVWMWWLTVFLDSGPMHIMTCTCFKCIIQPSLRRIYWVLSPPQSSLHFIIPVGRPLLCIYSLYLMLSCSGICWSASCQDISYKSSLLSLCISVWKSIHGCSLHH